MHKDFRWFEAIPGTPTAFSGRSTGGNCHVLLKTGSKVSPEGGTSGVYCPFESGHKLPTVPWRWWVWKVRMPGTQEVASVATGHRGGADALESRASLQRSDEDQ